MLNDNTIYGLDVVSVTPSSQTILYVACGKAQQLQQIDVTNAFGSSPLNAPQMYSIMGGIPALRTVLVDRSDPNQVYVGAQNNFYIVDTSSTPPPDPPTRNAINGGLNMGTDRDTIQVELLDGTPTVWTTGSGSVDYVCKVFNVDPALTGQVPTIEAFYSMFASDGGVAHTSQGETYVYVPTFGGIVRFSNQNGSWHADATSYTPAFGLDPATMTVDTKLAATEHLYIATVDAGGQPSTRLYTPTGGHEAGSLMEFELDSTGAILPPTRYGPDTSQFPSYWHPNNPLFSTDASFVDLGQDGHFAFVNLTNFSTSAMGACSGSSCTQTLVLAYKWNEQSALWEHKATTDETQLPIPLQDVSNLPASISESVFATPVYVNSVPFIYVFCALEKGFYIAKWDLANSFPVVQFVENLDDGNGGTNVVRNVNSIERSRERVFVLGKFTTSQASNRLALRMYRWNETTGIISDELDGWVAADFDYDGDPLTASFKQGFRLRFYPSGSVYGDGDLYVTTKRSLLRMQYGGYAYNGIATGCADRLGFTGWLDRYDVDAIQDARVFDFAGSPKLLVVKDRETFLVTDP